MAVFEIDIVIQETDLDVFGHVNNAVYLRLFENARWKFITDRGVGLREIERDQIGPVILEVHVKFMRELKARDKVKIRSEFLPFQGKIAHIKQSILTAQGAEACTADFTIAVFDMKARKIISPPENWMQMG